MATEYLSRPMVYGPNAPKDKRLLCHGQYEGYDFYIYNQHGNFPLAYVSVPVGHPLYEKDQNDPLIENLKVHGNVTYAAPTLMDNPEGWYVGWDYAHMGDYRACPMIPQLTAPGKKYKTADIIKDCEAVIDEMKEMQ